MFQPAPDPPPPSDAAGPSGPAPEPRPGRARPERPEVPPMASRLLLATWFRLEDAQDPRSALCQPLASPRPHRAAGG